MQCYSYQSLSTVVTVMVPAFFQSNILEDDHEFAAIEKDMFQELQKLGAIKELIIPRKKDLGSSTQESAVGKVFVEYEDINSAFACFNLLNNRPYMGSPVEIHFFDKGAFFTKSLY
mmetsp:Transcript_27716/g.26750  ORF Transcript_27716/g.26750 Transcript_27716/m.26750 type:complete len:116 (+) Transcript_27716:966-1313(+)